MLSHISYTAVQFMNFPLWLNKTNNEWSYIPYISDEYELKGCFIFRFCSSLTHWGRVTHICVGNLIIIDSDNGLSPGRRQAIIWTNAGILLIRSVGTNFSDFLSEIRAFSFKKMHLKMSSAKWRPFCLGLNVLKLINPFVCDNEHNGGKRSNTNTLIPQIWVYS